MWKWEHNITGLNQETRKTSNKQYNFSLKLERQQMKLKVSRTKEIAKIRAEINKIQYKRKKQYKRSVTPRAGSLKT